MRYNNGLSIIDTKNGDAHEFLFVGINDPGLRNQPNAAGGLIFANLIFELNYINANGDVTSVPALPAPLPDVDGQKFGVEGYLRYNSKLVRWQEWFCNIQNMTRLLMRHQLEWVSNPVVSEIDAISPETTEYPNNNTFDIDYFN
jgi:hypothetical protein